jgi:TetR/AcrR family transcriptional regulator, cholesterol catabolism regulator
LHDTLKCIMDNRNRIIEGAAELFRTYGIKTVTMDSLANHLGISKRTIYEIFSDKDDLLVGVMKWMVEKQRELVKKVLDESENAIAAIFRLLQINSDHIQNMSPAFQADMKRFHTIVLMKKADNYEMPDFKSNLQVIEQGIKEKLFRKDINPDLVNRCLYSLGRSIMDHDLYPYEIFSRREVMRNTFIIYLRGIATTDGLHLINKLDSEF